MHTTLNAIRAHAPCTSGWARLLRYLGKTEADDGLLPILTIIDSNGLDDALWCLRTVGGHDREIRLLGVAYARRVQHLMYHPDSVAALDVAERCAHGEATVEELAAARAAAWTVAWVAVRQCVTPAAQAAEAAWAASVASSDASIMLASRLAATAAAAGVRAKVQPEAPGRAAVVAKRARAKERAAQGRLLREMLAASTVGRAMEQL